MRSAILSFVGPYDQIPPMYSALKVNGQKLCDLARKGQVVEREEQADYDPFDRNRGHFIASRDDARGVLPLALQYSDALSRYRTEAGLRRSDGAAGTDTLRQFQS